MHPSANTFFSSFYPIFSVVFLFLLLSFFLTFFELNSMIKYIQSIYFIPDGQSYHAALLT
ncbi:hypothetical protein B5F11_06135 [Anaerotruncus colihominis]|uniref:Uncharacterized protein n=2 Tax=Anaerotruncus colihominis TaxID=169435 RepID=B0P8K9_9FIRM|nr:hypothetical protein ANACOL_01098 [Anaerotruncus colihominis DSM 17241]OUO68213.1 hypothetical protein B5F55_04925 [Anaerotruncus colihominis]OUP70212.1 hypothetical protein B5F11_06135 [Anaerotruncus colihominis]